MVDFVPVLLFHYDQLMCNITDTFEGERVGSQLCDDMIPSPGRDTMNIVDLAGGKEVELGTGAEEQQGDP